MPSLERRFDAYGPVRRASSILESKQRNLPGAVVMVAHKGRLVYSDAIGFQDSQGAKPLPKDAIFRTFSMTKPLAMNDTAFWVPKDKLQRLAEPLPVDRRVANRTS